MTIYGDVEQRIRQQFLLLHRAWDDAHWMRKKDPTDELRRYLHVLAGISATWQGILKSDQYYKVSPNMVLDSGLTTSVSWSICNIMVNTHPKYQMPESLAGLTDTLPSLDIGEALVVGDAVLLPSRIKIDPPSEANRPRSATIDFWDEWAKKPNTPDFSKSVENMRRQRRSS